MGFFKAPSKKVDLDRFIKDVAKWGLSLGIASTAAAGIGAGASKAIDVVEDKLTRDKNKSKILNIAPELREVSRDKFEAMYNTVRRMGFQDEPLFAAEAMKRMHSMPESVVGLLPEVLRARGEYSRAGGRPGALASNVASIAQKPLIGDLDPINFP